MRHNRVNFFEGVIAKVRFTPSVVAAADFLPLFAAGDFDRNGAVEAADYEAWRNSFGELVAAGAGADGNRDGVVDAADFTVWRDALAGGAAGNDPLSAVPEPGVMVLAAGMLVVGLSGGREWLKECRRVRGDLTRPLTRARLGNAKAR
jgi:hypothetical protein